MLRCSPEQVWSDTVAQGPPRARKVWGRETRGDRQDSEAGRRGARFAILARLGGFGPLRLLNVPVLSS